VTHDHTRKHFIAKLLGMIAAAGFAPKLLAKPARMVTAEPAAPAASSFQLRSESRAVARAANSV
jgi:hypothetical protein